MIELINLACDHNNLFVPFGEYLWSPVYGKTRRGNFRGYFLPDVDHTGKPFLSWNAQSKN